ncbi:hypothetical protein KHQ06_33380 [Nocardia tengchongensis]|uniref:Uncharacterized protein n=1 Tax=Nocardia tengchongensis TaxID=2055889 RepID=A0ABX8CRT5_9NOCA|nr:hypothetical protein [Nocardia tengchongensis]QVI20920.1 hypothetical protein KHQ06_33380 [Nocardia tengchongensis]
MTAALPTTSGLLLILDGVTDASVIAGLIPRASLCRILITTVVANLDSGYRELPLAAWEHRDSRAFLYSLLPRETSEDRDRLREALYDNPLAINQAVDHCRVRSRSIDDYLKRLDEAPAYVLELGRATGHKASIIESIRINIDTVRDADPDALVLLTILALLGPSPVHESLFDAPFPLAFLHPPSMSESANATPRWWKRCPPRHGCRHRRTASPTNRTRRADAGDVA